MGYQEQFNFWVEDSYFDDAGSQVMNEDTRHRILIIPISTSFFLF